MVGNKFILVAIFFLAIVTCSYAQDKPAPAQKGLSGINTQAFENAPQSDKLNWNNNPFVAPANDVPVSGLKLTGIVFSKEAAAAVINNQILKKGDKIGPHEVVDISKTTVVLRNESGLFSLSLKEMN